MVIASWGDNITPPPQALNWIPDLYESVDEIRAHEQVIVYTLDQRIGHLGIFVSAKVAEKQHAEIVNTIDLIGSLPPGLYEMIIEDKRPEDIGVDLLPGNYLVRFEARTIQDILALDDGREDEKAFETVARISEINEGLYDTFVSPWVRLFANEATAEALRLMHPLRLERFLISDMNPLLWPLQAMAQAVRENRRPVAPDNPFVEAERAVSRADRAVARSLSRAARPLAGADCSRRSTTRPWSRRSPGCAAPYADARKPRARDEHAEQLLAAKIEAIKTREEQGGFAEAVLRIMLAVAQAEHMFDARGLRLAQRIKQEHPVLRRDPARADQGRREGGGVHAALRRGAGARRPAANAADRGGAARGGRDRAADRLRRRRDQRPRARPCSARIERILGLAGRRQAASEAPPPPAAVAPTRAARPVDAGARIGRHRPRPHGGEDEEGAGPGRDRAAAARRRASIGSIRP